MWRSQPKAITDTPPGCRVAGADFFSTSTQVSGGLKDSFNKSFYNSSYDADADEKS